ncbi:MAG: hypothetical protein JXR94_23455 [Candidatus Hydrogenedentes bacterium]|nr:hypothetical protein [Candidatus Hydrogenedentota bacterium]
MRVRRVLVRFAQRHPRLAATALGLLAAFGILVLSETLCYALNARREHWTFQSRPMLRPDPTLGYRLRPNRRVPRSKSSETRLAYYCWHTIDQYGRRHTPVAEPDARDRFLFLFGGSFAFGDGLNDDQTLASHIAGQAPRYQPCVFACGGYGTAHMLIQIQDPALLSEVPQSTGIALYLFTDPHIPRLIGNLEVAGTFGKRFPYYTVENGQVLYRGSFEEGRPFTTWCYRLLAKSHTVNYLGFSLPLHALNPRSADLFVRIVAESQRAFNLKYPDATFYVLFYPGMKFTATLKPLLEQQGIPCLDYPDLFPGPPESYRLIDGHPNEHANELLAARLVQDLRLDDAATPEAPPTAGESVVD